MKYELLIDDTITFFGVQLFRIKALISFKGVKKGDVGGYVESEKNLSQHGNAWVSGDAKVYGDAKVSGNAEVSGNAWVSGDAKVSGDADYIVFKNNWSSRRYFTYTKSNKKWKVGCFCGNSEELIKKAYKDSKKSGDFYKAYVEFVEKLEAIENGHKEQ